MADEEEKLPAELRMKLLEVEKFQEQRDYPDWKRGAKFGGLGIFSAALVFPIVYLAMMGSKSESTGNLILCSAGVVLSVMIIAFAFGAFRPPRDDS